LLICLVTRRDGAAGRSRRMKPDPLEHPAQRPATVKHGHGLLFEMNCARKPTLLQGAPGGRAVRVTESDLLMRAAMVGVV
jgi:hypothetical protein